MTHVYTGPTTPYGLRKGSPCEIVGKRAGGTVIKTSDCRRWIVGSQQLRAERG